MSSVDKSPKLITSEQFEEPSVISNVVEYFSNYINIKKVEEIDNEKLILWATFASCDYNDSRYDSDKRNVVLIIGRLNGIQVYLLKSHGNLVLIFSLIIDSVLTALVLPSPSSNSDKFAGNRPLLVCSVDTRMAFYSLRTGKCVKENDCQDRILQIEATEKLLVGATCRDLILICSNRLSVLCRLTNCKLSLDPYSHVAFSLSDHWLAFADNHVSPQILSIGGDISEPGSIPYAVTLSSVKKKVISSLGSGDNVNHNTCDENQMGVVTIIDVDLLIEWVSSANPSDCDTHLHTHMILAHFIAHIWTPVARMVFDTTGTLLLTACSQGLFCNLFRIAPHPTSSKQAGVLHLYRLKRGDTPCTIVSMGISKDGRLASASSSHGTVHIWPISSYGGPLCVRTHCQKHVVNRLSRLERSAGLQEYQVTRPHAANVGISQEGLLNHAFHTLSPRLPPMPVPCTFSSYVQLKPISHIPSTQRPLVLVPHFPHVDYSFSSEQYTRSEPILVFSIDGRLIQYSLRHHPDTQHQTSSRIELDGPFVIDKQSMLQWKLPLTDISNCVDKTIINKHYSPSNFHITVSNQSNSQSALLPSVIPDLMNQFFVTNSTTPKCWYSHIEISSQISSTSNIRRQDKFSISTYQTRDSIEARLEVLQKSPSISSDLSLQFTQNENDNIDSCKSYLASQPVKVPFSEQRIQICNSFCGSSVSDSLGGSIDNVCSALSHALWDDDEYTEPPQDIMEDPKSGYIEFMTKDIGQARLRRVSGSFSSENGRVIGFSTSPLEADIIEELDISNSPNNKQSKLSKRYDKKKGRRN